MAQNTKQELDKAIAGMNKGIDKKEEMRLMMAPHANWDTFLTPAPLSIALLGQLILISSDADFSLQDKKDSIKFEFLKYPDSFRACLVQVSNRGWDAFNKAHTSMDQIRLYSSNVDKHVKTAVRFLISGSAEDVQSMVPDALKNIEVIADDCLELATSVEKEFVAVMKLIAELLEACTRAKGQHEEDLKASKIAHEVAEEHMKAVQAEKEQAVGRRNEMEKQMKEANEEFKDAFKSMPGAWDIIGKACADTMISATRFAGNIPSMIWGGLRWNTRYFQESQVNEPTRDSNRPQHSEGVLAIYKIVPDVYGLVETLVTLAHGGEVMKGDKRAKKGVLRSMKALEIITKNRLEEVNESRMKSKVLHLCKDAIDLSQTLSKKAQVQYSQEEIEEIHFQADTLLEEADILLGVSHSVLGTNALPNTSPNLAKEPVYNSDGGLVQQALNSYRFRTETAKEMLKDSRRAYEASCDEVAKKTREMTNLLVEMKELDLKEIDMEKIRKTLVKGIEALGELREQWGKLVQFFQMLSNLVKCCLSTSLKTFVQTSRNRLDQGDHSMSAAMRDVIFEQAFQANQIAYVVNGISSVYVEVSNEHLMERITCLGKLIALDPATNSHMIMQKREELNRGCAEAQEAIRRIALKKKREITEAFDKRIGRIENEVEVLLPPISEKRAEEIKEKVKSNIAMSKTDIDAVVDDLT
ncbi:uncharacterized protein [Acropora muricata]|uniref:uncharacterized protein n=1 Tax=Acropora muricata TaxID=159855 RepID=UPI0034E58916